MDLDPRSSQPVEAMPAAVRARTILAGSHHVWVQHGGAAKDPDDVVLVGLVDAAGRPHLLLQPWEVLPPGRVRLTCTQVADEVGVLTVSGELEDRVAAGDVPEVLAALHLGEPCVAAEKLERAEGVECPWCPDEGVAVMPVAVSGLRLAAAAGPRGGVRPVSVDPVRFRNATPDRWALHGTTAIRHLEERHQRELLNLVRDNALRGVTAVSVRAADADGLVLTCLAGDGVADVVLPFAPQLRDPRAMIRRLLPGGSPGPFD